MGEREHSVRPSRHAAGFLIPLTTPIFSLRFRKSALRFCVVHLKRHAYGTKRIGAFHGQPQKLERSGRDFSPGRGVFRSPERPEGESASRKQRDPPRAIGGESERTNPATNRSATTGQNR